MMSIDENELLVGEDEFYDLWIDCQKLAVELADKLNLTDEQLERIKTRWSNINGSDGHAMAALASYAMTIRRFRKLTEMVQPGETLVSVQQLAARLNNKGEA